MKVKSIILFTVAFGMSQLLIAQKAKVVSAYNYNKAFERNQDCGELEKGVTAIESAIEDSKTKEWAKTWYYGGNIYFNAALAKDEACTKRFDEPVNKTLEFYVNALKYNIEQEGSNDLDLQKQEDQQKFIGFLMNEETSYDDPTYTRDILGNKFPYLANALINKGVEAYQADNFKKAKDMYEKSIMVNAIMGRVDSLGMYNAAIASERMKEYEDAFAYYQILSQINYGGADIYIYMANILERKKDTASKMEVIRKGLEKYPDNASLIREELSYLLAVGKTDEALAKFDKAIEKDPSDATLYYNRALIYDRLGELEKAAKDYNKAEKADPEFFDAIYNLGAMYFNAGAEENNKASNYGMDEQSKYEVATEKANDYFAKAKPALEKAHEMKPTDKGTIASLVKIYAILGDNDKYKEMKSKLKE